MASVLTTGRDPTRVVGRRAGAWILDSVIDVVILLGVIELLNIDLERTSSTGTLYDFTGDDPGTAAAIVLTTLAWAAVKVLTVAAFGWTPGKLLCAVRVVGWDGRPPGFLRAFGRGLTVVVLGFFGCIYWVIALAMMALTKEHRQPADFVAGTWVVDSIFLGRLVMHGPSGALVGPPSVTREEAGEIARERNLPAAATIVPPAGHAPTKPFYDKPRDTYVVWNEKRSAWLQFDKSSEQWVPLR